MILTTHEQSLLHAPETRSNLENDSKQGAIYVSLLIGFHSQFGIVNSALLLSFIKHLLVATFMAAERPLSEKGKNDTVYSFARRILRSYKK